MKNKSVRNSDDMTKVGVLLDKEGLIYKAGRPSTMDEKELAEAIRNGDTYKEVSLEEYQQMGWSKIYGYAK